MRGFAICSVSVLSLSLGAAWAADPAPIDDSGIRFLLESQSSYVILSGDQLDTDEDENFSASAGVARLNIDLGNGFNLQGDAFGEIAWTNDSTDNAYASALGGGLHAYMRGNSGAFGAYGALADIDINNDDDDDGNDSGGLARSFGVEALWFSDELTLGAQAGLVDSDMGDDEDMIRDAFFVRGLARYYVSESTLLQGEASYLSGEMDSDNDDVSIVSVGARIQHELDFIPGDFNWPGKVYLAYRGDFANQSDPTSASDSGNIDSHTIMFGTTFTFGHSLIDNERNGAAFDLPAFARWNSISAGAME